jgi:hypothetical protein
MKSLERNKELFGNYLHQSLGGLSLGALQRSAWSELAMSGLLC